MRFKLKYSVQGLAINDKEVNFEIKLSHTINVKISKPDDAYKELLGGSIISFCDAELVIEPTQKNQKIFENIINNKIVNDVGNMRSYGLIKNERNEDIVIPQLDILPEHFKDFIKQINHNLALSIKKTISTIRWVCDNRGPHNPFSVRGFEWTIDDKFWYMVPPSGSISEEWYSPDIIVSKSKENIIFNLLKDDNEEPTHHSLFREAWSLKSENPKSSLILGISAIEVSLKYLIKRVAPNAYWLIKNIQSPPVHKIFQGYINELQIDKTYNGVSVVLTETMINDLEKWVNIRNNIAHHGFNSLAYKNLTEVLMTLKDILHIIDFYSGHKWSIEHIRESTLKEIESINHEKQKKKTSSPLR